MLIPSLAVLGADGGTADFTVVGFGQSLHEFQRARRLVQCGILFGEEHQFLFELFARRIAAI